MQEAGAREVADWPSISAILVGISAFGLALGLTYRLAPLLLAGRGVMPYILPSSY